MTQQTSEPPRDSPETILPAPDEMYRATLERDSSYDGVFFLGVKTTGVFCRPICPARKPRLKNVRFFSSTADALAAGFRPCKRCRPMQVAGQYPPWLCDLIKSVEAQPDRRWRDQDIRELGVHPARVSRWFKANHGITFHGFARARRLSAALAQLSVGDDVTRVALNAGYESLSGFRDAFQKWLGTTPGRFQPQQAVMVNRLLTPLGPMVAAANQEHLLLLEFADRRMLQSQMQRLAGISKSVFCPGENGIIHQAAEEMAAYFEGRRAVFEVSIQTPGTEFQQAVWRQLLRIPYGETTTYDILARRLGRNGASRAVGRANGDNRLAILVPCHRVIRSDGRLSGYGGGVRRKEWLLRHEQAQSGMPAGDFS